ncbi:MAG: glycerophosphodiester phosphodiesterase family protein [Ahrensia sp.]
MNPLDALLARPITHRGLHDGNKAVMENSLTAVMASAAAGYPIEIDVQLSADDVAIMFHDETLDRLTKETGPVRQRTAEQLRAIKLGDTDDTPLPLADVLKAINGRVPIVVEMKDNGKDNDALAQAVARDLLAYDGPCAAMSFAYDLVAAFVHHAPTIDAGLTAEGIVAEKLALHRTFLDRMGDKISFMSYGVTNLPNDLVTQLRRDRHMKIITWTVRDEATRARCADHVDQITFELFTPDERK